MRRNLKNIIFCSVLSLLLMANSAYAIKFVDIPHGYWAYKAIDKVSDDGIITGSPDNKFMPEQLITRSQYAVMLVKALNQQNIPVETMYSFEDIDVNNWAWPYVLRALNLDILKPCADCYFCPNDYITRSEVITFLVNLLKTENITKKEAIESLQNAYDDFDEIPDWFKQTAGKAEFLNLIAKEPPRQRYLDYDNYVTRAQMAVFLANMKREIESYESAKIEEETSPKIARGIISNNVIVDGDVALIPEKSILPIMIMGQISSKDTKAGQMFQARFANNIVDEQHRLLLSKDLILIGKVLDSVKAKKFVRNGELMFELSAVNNDDILTKIFAFAEYEASYVEGNKFKKATSAVIKGRNFTAKDGQILYIKLFQPIRVNIVTGEILD
ncbi:S-layer homology domain-containing protein [bacterium]|nr:S-layer homology domain-containing protein [bacterium]